MMSEAEEWKSMEIEVGEPPRRPKAFSLKHKLMFVVALFVSFVMGTRFGCNRLPNSCPPCNAVALTDDTHQATAVPASTISNAKTAAPTLSPHETTDIPTITKPIVEITTPTLSPATPTSMPTITKQSAHTQLIVPPESTAPNSDFPVGLNPNPLWSWAHVEDVSTLFTPSELVSITWSGLKGKVQCNGPEACCLGAGSKGVGTYWKDSTCKDANYHHKYKVSTTGKPLTKESSEGDQRDAFKLLESLELLPNNTKVVFTGDSVTRQSYDAAICSLSRSPLPHEHTVATNINVAKLLNTECHKDNWQKGIAENFVNQVNWTSTRTGEGHSVYVSIAKQYLPNFNRNDTRLLCQSTDVLIVNYGLHFNLHPTQEDIDSEVERSITEWAPKIMAEIRDCMVKDDVVVIWRETMTQHYATPGGSFERHRDMVSYPDSWYPVGPGESIKDETLGKRSGKVCSPVKFLNLTEEWRFRDREFEKTFLELGLTPLHTDSLISRIDSGDDNIVGVGGDAPLRVPWVDLYEKSLSQWDVHKTNNECTHLCYSPTVWEPLWDGLYLALRNEVALGTFEGRLSKDGNVLKPWAPKPIAYDDFARKSNFCKVNH